MVTSLNGALFPLCIGKSVDEVCKGAMAAEKLLVGAALCDFSIYQHEDMVSLWQEAHPMGHQDAGLYRKPHESDRKGASPNQKKHESSKCQHTGGFHIMITIVQQGV